LRCITIDELQFKLEELQQLVSKTATIKLSDPELQQLLSTTTGWPALLHISLAAKSRSKNGQTPVDLLTSYVADTGRYLAEEVLGPETPLQRQALRSAAITQRFNDQLLQTITQSDVTVNELYKLPGIGLLIKRLDVNGHWFELHPLLRELLLQEFRQQPQDQIDQKYGRASQWCYDNQLIAEAIELFIDNEQYNSALTIMTQRGYEIIAKGELNNFLALTRRLPSEIIGENHDLLLQQAWQHLLVNEHELSELLQQMVQQRSVDYPLSPLSDYSMRCMQLTTNLRLERYDKIRKLGLPLLQERIEAPDY
jgi:serine/threonine-protein kinase PknK